MKISFQGIKGSYSHMACVAVYPDAKEYIGCNSFEDALNLVKKGSVDLAVIPIENSSAGRVADMHWILPHTNLYMVHEYFQPIHHCLMGTKNSDINSIKNVYSHPQALSQCRKNIQEKELTANNYNDTATAAKMVADSNNKYDVAIASKLAAQIYGLKILADNFQDFSHNTTRFISFSNKQTIPNTSSSCITSLIFKVKNIPSALYKAMGGFATNGINMLRIESYMLDGKFSSAQFYLDIAGNIEDKNVKNAISELKNYAYDIKILGCYLENRSNL